MEREAKSTRPKPFVFVLMPLDPKFEDIYKFGIQGAAAEVGAYAERVDEQIFMDGMLDRIFNQISKADVVVADMTGRNPNVFYEVGYAHALDKVVLLLTQDSNDIPFDLKHRQHTVYGGKIAILRNELAKKLQWAIAESQRRSDRSSAEFISLAVMAAPVPEGSLDFEDVTTLSGEVPTTENVFRLPIQLRNEGADTLRAISHIYLFAEEGAVVVPGEMPETYNFISISGVPNSPTNQKPQELDSFTANPMDAPDGLIRQYRVPITFPALPPGAIEQEHLRLMFKEGKSIVDAKYCLRLHSDTRIYDYKFRLKLKVSAPEEPGVA